MTSTPSTTTISLLRPATVAQICGVSPPTVYRWIADGVPEAVPAFRAEGKDPLYTVEQARQLAEWRLRELQNAKA